jgi:hypothetical protein
MALAEKCQKPSRAVKTLTGRAMVFMRNQRKILAFSHNALYSHVRMFGIVSATAIRRPPEPGARTGIHHHGAQHTIVYVLSGSSYVRWGERGG